MDKLDFSDIAHDIFEKSDSCNDGKELAESKCNCSKGKYKRACTRSAEQASKFLSLQTGCGGGDVNIILHTSFEQQKKYMSSPAEFNDFYRPYIIAYMQSLILEKPVKFSHLVEHADGSFEGKFIKDYVATVMPEITKERHS